MAARHVKGSALGLDLISQCQLEILKSNQQEKQEPQPSKTFSQKVQSFFLPFLSKAFAIRNHWAWNIFIHIVVISHVALSFFESKTKRTDLPKPITIGKLELQIGIELDPKEAIPEFCLLFIELTDVFIKIAWMNMCPQHILRPKSEKRYAYLNLL